MRVPFSLFFVGWWTAGQRWMVTGQYPKPSASVSPEMVILGGNVTVHCSQARYADAKLLLYKSSSLPLLPKTTKDYEAEFIISNISISDAGIYRCISLINGSKYSPYSDDIPINVTDPSLLKPTIKVKPKRQIALRSNVTIECKGKGGDVNFFLRKAKTREVSQVVATTTAKASFSFFSVRVEDAGSYICQYHQRSMPFVWSEPSDPVELILKDPSLSKPSIKVRPQGWNHVGANVTIECSGLENGLNFSLHKSKDLTVLQMLEAKGQTAHFSLLALRLEDAGNYTCQSCRRENPFLCSERSGPVQVTVTDKSPKISKIIIWTSAAAGLLLVLFLLVLILVLCKKRKKRSTVNGGNQPVNRILEQKAGTDHDDTADNEGITYAVVSQPSLKTKQPASQPTSHESCIYASVTKGGTRKV